MQMDKPSDDAARWSVFTQTCLRPRGKGQRVEILGQLGTQKGLLTHRLPTVKAVGHFETRCQIPTKRRKRVTGDAPIEREEEEVGAHAYAGRANFAEVQEVLRGRGREGVGGDGRGRRPNATDVELDRLGGVGLGEPVVSQAPWSK